MLSERVRQYQGQGTGQGRAQFLFYCSPTNWTQDSLALYSDTQLSAVLKIKYRNSPDLQAAQTMLDVS